MSTAPTFLVIQTAFIGDVILALGTVQALKARYPVARVEMLVRRGCEGLLAGHPDVDHVWVWDKARKWASLRQLLAAMRQQRYQGIINLQRFFTMGLFTMLLRAERRAGFRESPFAWAYAHSAPHQRGDRQSRSWLHETARNHALLAPWQVGPLQRPRLYPSPDDLARVAPYTQARPYLVCAPASVWATKQWPEARWAELLRSLPTTVTVYLVGGPGDAALCARLAAAHPNAHNLAGALSLLQTAALMTGAHRVVANDSAPLHLASAMNAPSTALFCSTLPAFGFGPLAADAITLQEQEQLACRPCGLHGRRACPEGHFRCGWAITSEAVYASLQLP